MTHDQLVQRAVTAIEEVFSDMSVSQETTKDSLEALIENIKIQIEALQYDMGG